MNDSLKEKIKNFSPETIRKLMSERKVNIAEENSDESFRMLRNKEEKYPLSKAQERIWFLSKLTDKESVYNIPLAVKLQLNVTRNDLAFALNRIVEQNEILRTTFHEENEVLFQKIHPPFKVNIEYEDLSEMDCTLQEEELENMAVRHVEKYFDLEKVASIFGKIGKAGGKGECSIDQPSSYHLRWLDEYAAINRFGVKS